MGAVLKVENVAKTFILHNQAGARLAVIEHANFNVDAGEVVVLGGPSGVGKSTLLRMLFGNYRPNAGHIRALHGGRFVDLVSAAPRQILDVRRQTLRWVSQFLRVIPRVATLDLVRDPMLARGVAATEATERARTMLARLNMPERLWGLPPQTFSGGEQQRVNIARSFVSPSPILLLDEPTASLDATNRAVVIALIQEARARGSAIVGIFHDADVRDAVANRTIDVGAFAPKGAI
jgi:alpha-D-ribose 1-methylphosphonate 5-triphosphate synthase subunit PhnL